MKLKAATQEEARRLTVQLNLHQAQAQAVYNFSRVWSYSVTAIALDFMRNLPVPNTITNYSILW
jgi:hypothetical protein